MRAEEALLPPEDDDEWMTIDPKELDETLEKYRRRAFVENGGGDEAGDDGGIETGKKQAAGKKQKTSRRRKEEENEFDLNQISQTFKQFVQHVSEFDGVEFPGEISQKEDINNSSVLIIH